MHTIPMPKKIPMSDAPLKLLIADDDLLYRTLIQGLLSAYEPRITSMMVSSGFDALRAQESFLPDVILLDIMMERMNGLVAAHFIKTKTPSVPVIFVSSYAGKELLQNIQRSPADGFLSKHRFIEHLKRGEDPIPLMESGMASQDEQ